MKVMGLISGTSMDGIDVAVVDFVLTGSHLTARLVWDGCVAYEPDLRARLLAALPPAATTLAEVCELDTAVGQAFADAAARAVAGAGPVDVICSHGQTVFHWVEDGAALGTLQIGQPAWIAERLGTPVVSDIRARDLTVGGQGAPLASLIDALLLGGVPGTSAALNLGGIANITVVRDGAVYAFDTGPANALMDAVVADRGLDPAGYDQGGRIAARGVVDAQLLDGLLAEPYYRQEPPKSTGKELFHLPYLMAHLDRLDHPVDSADLLATLAELTGETVADAVRRAGVTYLAVSGGGAHNPVVMGRLRALLDGVTVVTTGALGVPADAKEAILMALIGWCTWHGVPGIVPGGTGAREPRILGVITPGRGPLVLPAPVGGVTALTVGGGTT